MRTSARFALTIAVLVSLAACGHENCGEVARREASPNGRFELVVCRDSATSMSVPAGQADDRPGRVILRDIERDEVLAAASLDMVSAMAKPQWYDDHVLVPLVADWKLPPGRP